MELAINISLTLLLVLINGYFSMSEMALISARRSALQQIIEEGEREPTRLSRAQARKAERVVELASNSDRMLATIQVAITLVGVGASAVAATAFSAPIASWLKGFNIAWLSALASPLALVFITLIISYVSLIIGELVPKRIALANAERTAMSVAGPVAVFEKLAGPLITLLSASTNGVARLFGIKRAEEREAVSEDEIKYLVTEQNSLLDEEKRMIHEIFDLGDTVAREVMTPRVDMISVEDDATVRQTVDRMRGTGHSRVPVFSEVPDRVVGVAMIKDLLAPLLGDHDDEPITTYMRDPFFVPETKDILPLLGELQTQHQQMAIVVDEYGGTAGIITVEDIVEEIVGDISDEYDADNKYQTQLSEGEWLIDGRLPTDDAIELGLPVTDEDDYETIAGWLMDTIDSVPQIGDSYGIGGFVFKVVKMRRNRISMLRVTRDEKQSDDLQMASSSTL